MSTVINASRRLFRRKVKSAKNRRVVQEAVTCWVPGLSFLAIALWTLVPDKFDEKDAKLARSGVFGTTLGMMIADVPAVFVGGRIADRLPVRLVHAVAAAIFAILGTVTLLGGGERFGF